MIKSKYSLFIVIYLLIIVCSAILIPPGIYSDSGWGFITLKSMQNGATFCHSLVPDPSNIGYDLELYNTWWTPGQYIYPGIFIYLFKLNLGWSIILTVILFSYLGLIGYYKMFLRFGFEDRIALISIFIIITQRYFLLPFSIYNGGEILLFGILPWVIITYDKLYKLEYYYIPIFIIIAIIGYIIKSSFLIFFIASIIYIALKNILTSYNTKSNKTSAFLLLFSKQKNIIYLKLATIFFISYIIIYHFFLKYNNPSETKLLNFELLDILIPLSSPITSAFSIDDLLNRIFYHPQENILTQLYINKVIVYFPMVILNLYFIYYILIRKQLTNYLVLYLSIFTTYLLVFIYLYSFDAAVSYEHRHFRIIGILSIPLLIKAILESSSFLKILSFLLILFISVYGIVGYINRKIFIYNSSAKSYQYFSQMNIDQETLNKVYKLDDSLKSGNNLFYFTSPEIALDIKKNRFISSHADFQSLESLKKEIYNGTVDNLYLIIQTKLRNEGKEKIIKRSFKNYKDFDVIFENRHYRILYGHKY